MNLKYYLAFRYIYFIPMIIKKSILLLLGLFALTIMTEAQTYSSKNTPLILITEKQHQPIQSLTHLNQVSKTLQTLSAVSITTGDIQNLIGQLKEYAKSSQIQKEQISSLLIDRNEIEKLKDTQFEDIVGIEQLKSIIQQKGQNILIQIHSNQRQQRKLVENSQILIKSYDEPTISPLFLNMDSVTLTGLLVSLFLIIVLMVAVKCLYDVKTNDQFGRTNLWVGKES